MSLRASAGPNYASRCLCNLCARNSANTKLKQVAARSLCELNLNAAKYNYLFVVRLWILAVARCDFESVGCRTSWRNGCCVALHCIALLRCAALRRRCDSIGKHKSSVCCWRVFEFKIKWLATINKCVRRSGERKSCCRCKCCFSALVRHWHSDTFSGRAHADTQTER